MKATEFAYCLDRSAEFLRAANAPNLAGSLQQLASVFHLGSAKKVADVVAKLDALDVAGGSFLQTKVDSVAAILPALSKLASTLSPKSENDFKLVSDLLKKHARTSIEDWTARATVALTAGSPSRGRKTQSTQPLNSDLVERYHRVLETSLGDDAGFRTVFAKLEADSEMKAPEVAALAKRFASASVKARPTALKKIFARHQALMIGRAAAAATAGRIAG